MNLELAAKHWLWVEQKCLVVIEERTPVYGMGQPDVLGVTRGRYLTEIEIKRSLSDFKADARKNHRRNRELAESGRVAGMSELHVFPRQFYYLVPPDLVEKVKPVLPAWAGLMTLGEYSKVVVATIAPVNKASKKLSIHAVTRLARQMTSHMMGYALANHSIQSDWKFRDDLHYIDWVDPENGTYSI